MDREMLLVKEQRMRGAMNEIIPDYMHGSIMHWLWNGIEPGPFLASIICNNLKGAVFAADTTNKQIIVAYVEFFSWYMPGASWGSLEKMTKWSNAGGWNGMLNADPTESLKHIFTVLSDGGNDAQMNLGLS